MINFLWVIIYSKQIFFPLFSVMMIIKQTTPTSSFVSIYGVIFSMRLKKLIVVQPVSVTFKYWCVDKSILQFHWFRNKLLVQPNFKHKFVRIFLDHYNDVGVFYPIIIIIMTAANLWSLRLALSINLIVDWSI